MGITVFSSDGEESFKKWVHSLFKVQKLKKQKFQEMNRKSKFNIHNPKSSKMENDPIWSQFHTEMNETSPSFKGFT